jgi:hypothetical protein
MGTLFETRQTALLSLGDGNTPANPLLRMGIPAISSKWDLFAMGGRMYNLKQTTIGTACVAPTQNAAGIILTMPWVRFTVPTGYTIFMHHLNLSVAAAAGTLNEIALTYSATDTFTSSTGAALVPLNWRNDNPRSTCVTNCYVGATGALNIEAAITSPRVLYQDMIAAAFAVQVTNQYTIDKWWNSLIPIIGPASVCLYFQGNTTAPTGYFSMDWAEVQTINVKES